MFITARLDLKAERDTQKTKQLCIHGIWRKLRPGVEIMDTGVLSVAAADQAKAVGLPKKTTPTEGLATNRKLCALCVILNIQMLGLLVPCCAQFVSQARLPNPIPTPMWQTISMMIITIEAADTVEVNTVEIGARNNKNQSTVPFIDITNATLKLDTRIVHAAK